MKEIPCQKRTFLFEDFLFMGSVFDPLIPILDHSARYEPAIPVLQVPRIVVLFKFTHMIGHRSGHGLTAVQAARTRGVTKHTYNKPAPKFSIMSLVVVVLIID